MKNNRIFVIDKYKLVKKEIMEKGDYKYYKPRIEEFHDGFRYEYTSSKYLKVLDQRLSFKKMEYNGGGSEHNDIYNIMEEVEDGVIRVKELDKDDIEELGWKLEDCTKKDGCYFIFNDPDDTFGSARLHLWSRYHKSISPYNVDVEGFVKGLCFSGDIKNYNELEVIMNQLRIIKIK